MKNILLPALASITICMAACTQPTTNSTTNNNIEKPQTNRTSFTRILATAGPGVTIDGPDATIDLETFESQCDNAISTLEDQIKTLKSTTAKPTIDSVIRPFDELSYGASNFGSWAYFLSNVHPDEKMRNAGNECVQRFVELESDISLSREIFDLLVQVDLTETDQETRYFVEKAIRDYKSSGVNKSEKVRDEIRTLIQQSFSIGQEFGKNIREDVRYIAVENEEILAGLPEDYIDAHQPDKDGLIQISTNYPDYFPVMTYAENDQLRKDLRNAYRNRAYPANEEVLHKLLKARFELAQLLGHDNYAEAVTQDRMIGSAEAAEKFINEISQIVRPPAEKEKARLLKRYQQIDASARQVMPWQRSYVSELIRLEQYQVDAKQIRQYFQYNNVRDGIFKLIEDLFDLEIRPWQTSVWDESVEPFEVLDNGKLIGRFYLDMHPRDGKYKHAAQMTLRAGVLNRQIPLAALMCNFPGGDNSAGLMEHGQVETFLHEFGHMVHTMLSGSQQWASISGLSMERDFVEAPSQMLEEWVWNYQTLQSFAKNSEGEVLPEALFNKMLAARNFGLTTGTAVQTFYAALSLNFYNRDPETINFDQLVKELYPKYSVFDYVGGTHMFANFGHLNGYSSNYYTYQWSLAIASDLFTQFQQNGLRDKDTARKYRNIILGSAGSKPAAEFIEEFLGRPWSLQAYKERLESAVED